MVSFGEKRATGRNAGGQGEAVRQGGEYGLKPEYTDFLWRKSEMGKTSDMIGDLVQRYQMKLSTVLTESLKKLRKLLMTLQSPDA
jgi:hypothetical protein